MEANKHKREEYLDRIKDIPLESFVYIDESGIELTICKDRAWGKKGKILNGKKSGKYYERTNIISGLNMNRAIAPMVFNGSCNIQLFETWTEECLIKELNAGQVVILDNASSHKSQRTRELIESVGCKLIFLPPYSPDFNPIEKFWANMKRWIKGKIDEIGQIYKTIQQFFYAPNSS